MSKAMVHDPAVHKGLVSVEMTFDLDIAFRRAYTFAFGYET